MLSISDYNNLQANEHHLDTVFPAKTKGSAYIYTRSQGADFFNRRRILHQKMLSRFIKDEIEKLRKTKKYLLLQKFQEVIKDTIRL